MNLVQRAVTRCALTAYFVAVKSGCMGHPWMKRLFRRTYFFYKRHFSDPFFRLGQWMPDLFRGGHVLDVGANIGYTALVFARLVRPPFNVFAFEPEPANFELLKETIRLYGRDGAIVPVASAIGGSEGVADLWYNETHHGDHRVITPGLESSLSRQDRRFTVPMTTIDGFAQSRRIQSGVKFIKIDVQGYEPAVCEGMTQTLQNNPDIIVSVEYSPEHMLAMGFQPYDLLRYFLDKRFLVYGLGTDGRPRVVSERDLAKPIAGGQCDLLFSRSSLIGEQKGAAEGDGRIY